MNSKQDDQTHTSKIEGCSLEKLVSNDNLIEHSLMISKYLTTVTNAQSRVVFQKVVNMICKSIPVLERRKQSNEICSIFIFSIDNLVQFDCLRGRYLIIYVPVMNRHTELIVFNFCSSNSLGDFNQGFVNLSKQENFLHSNARTRYEYMLVRQKSVRTSSIKGKNSLAGWNITSLPYVMKGMYVRALSK